MAETSIEWADFVWNCLRGCTEISPGCLHCYAAAMAYRFSGPGMPYEGLVEKRPNGKVVWTGKIRTVPEKLGEPLRWRKPRRVFVNSMSDLFHEDVPARFIRAVFAVMGIASDHTFQVLTKRADRMAEMVAGLKWDDCLNDLCREFPADLSIGFARPAWPLPNVWLGVSVEDQARAGERVPRLLRTPAAVRWLSCEPLLGPVDIGRWLEPQCSACSHVMGVAFEGRWQCRRPGCSMRGEPQAGTLDWIVVGGESGHGARGCDLAWIRSIVNQCGAAGIPEFVKQLGSCPVATPVPGYTTGLAKLADRKGGDIDEFPEDLRVREFPTVGKAVAS